MAHLILGKFHILILAANTLTIICEINQLGLLCIGVKAAFKIHVNLRLNEGVGRGNRIEDFCL